MDVNGREKRVSFSNVLFVPGWNSGNLISLVLIMAQGGCYHYGQKNWIKIALDSNDRIIMHADIQSGYSNQLYNIRIKKAHVYTTAGADMVQYWHEALGYTSPQM